MTHLRLLGGAALDGPVAPDLSLWLCAALALRASPIAREQAAALLWPDAEAASAQNRLRQLLHRTRRTPLGPHLSAENGRLSWTGGSDVQDFLAACADQRWSDAAALYGGPLMDGLPLPDSDELCELFTQERAHLHERYVEALTRAAATLEARGQLADAALSLNALLAADPLHEAAVSALMRCLDAQGSAGRALSAYEQYRRALDAALGLEPGAALQAQARRLRHARPPGRPTLRGAPQVLTPFIGRDRELHLIRARLADPDCRWLTLSGPGGSGKTRLAAEAAAQLAGQFEGGAHFVPLAGCDPGQLARTVLAALDVPLQGQKEPDEQLAQALAQREVLLVLDNFEHLQADAARLPGWLLAAPGLRLLVTSRHRLDFQAESVLRLGGLDTALPGEDPLASPAGRLFVERARRADASFEAPAHRFEIERVCLRCEGLPLAVELAAAWVGEMDMEGLARALERDADAFPSRLRDVGERHRSLGTVFDHAWRLLPRTLAARYAALAVLRAPFGEGAARAIADATPEDLRELERRSLLQDAGMGLYVWHQNLRELAWAQLDAAAREASAARHLKHLLARAEAAAPQLHGPEQAQALAAHALIHDDLRAALAFALGAARWEEGLRLAGALHWYWYVRGHHAEGLAWLERFLVPFEAAPPSAPLGRALAARASLALERGQLDAALASAQGALAVHRALGDPDGEADALHALGLIARAHGDRDTERQHMQAALRLREQRGEPRALGTVLNDLGILEAQTGNRELAREYIRRSLILKEQCGDRQGVAYALGNLGTLSDDPHEELALYRQSLLIKRELGDVQGTAKTMFNCAIVARELNDLQGAREHLLEALQLFAQLEKLEFLAQVLEEVVSWLRRADDPSAALTLAHAALELPAHSGQPLPDHVREKLEVHARDLRFLPNAEGRRELGVTLTPGQALQTAIVALRDHVQRAFHSA